MFSFKAPFNFSAERCFINKVYYDHMMIVYSQCAMVVAGVKVDTDSEWLLA